MRTTDVFDVLHIERLSFDRPWSEEAFAENLKGSNCRSQVAISNGVIAGFLLYLNVSGSMRILNMAVHPEFRRTGIGTQLISVLMNDLSLSSGRLVSGIVRESNLGAQLFLKSMGFFATDIINGEFRGSSECGYLFEFKVPSVPHDRISNWPLF